MWNGTFCKIIFTFVIVIFQTVSRGQRQTYNCHPVFKKYLTLFHIIAHLIFSRIKKLNLDSRWCFDTFYYSTFFIHQNVRKDLTYMWVQLKLKHFVFNCYKNGWRERIYFFTFCDLNENFIFMSKFNVEACPQMKYELVVQRKEGHTFSYHVPKRPKVTKKLTLDIPKFKFQNRKLPIVGIFWRQTGLWEPNPPKNVQVFFADSESCE